MEKLLFRRDFSVAPSLLTEALVGISTDPPPPNALFWKLWDSAEGIANDVLLTDYFMGIQNGNLDPKFYGRLVNQDSYYCFRGQGSYATAATNPIDGNFGDFLKGKVASYANYNQTFTKFWHIAGIQGISPGNLILDYANSEASVAKDLNSAYMLCAMLPCEYLWSWIASRIDGSTPTNSLYRFWVEENLGFNGAYQMGNFLEQYRSYVNEERAMEIYRQSMGFELAIFTKATQASDELLSMLKKNSVA